MAETRWAGGHCGVAVDAIGLRDLEEVLLADLDTCVADVVGVGGAQPQVIPGLVPGDPGGVGGNDHVPDPRLLFIGDRPDQVVRQCRPSGGKGLATGEGPTVRRPPRDGLGQTAAGRCAQFRLGADHVDRGRSLHRLPEQVVVEVGGPRVRGRLHLVDRQVVGGDECHRRVAFTERGEDLHDLERSGLGTAEPCCNGGREVPAPMGGSQADHRDISTSVVLLSGGGDFGGQRLEARR